MWILIILNKRHSPEELALCASLGSADASLLIYTSSYQLLKKDLEKNWNLVEKARTYNTTGFFPLDSLSKIYMDSGSPHL